MIILFILFNFGLARSDFLEINRVSILNKMLPEGENGRKGIPEGVKELSKSDGRRKRKKRAEKGRKKINSRFKRLLYFIIVLKESNGVYSRNYFNLVIYFL